MNNRPSLKQLSHKEIKFPRIQNEKINQKIDSNKGRSKTLIIKEKNISDQPKSNLNVQTKILTKQQEKFICKIHTENDLGSGFLCHIPDPVLITNNHILNQENIKTGKKIQISFNNEENFKNITIDENRKIYTIEKDVKGNEINVTIVEIRPKEDDVQNQEFLEYDEYLLNNDIKNKYDKKEIYAIHYKNGKCILSIGVINEIIKKNNTYDIVHTIDTGPESSGCPLILFNNTVIGVQRGFLKNENFKKGTLLQFPINEYNKKYYSNNFVKEDNKMKNEKKVNIVVEDKKNEILIKVKTKKEDIGKKINLLNYNEALSCFKKQIKNDSSSGEKLKDVWCQLIKDIEKQLSLLNEENITLEINNKKEIFTQYFIPKNSKIFTFKFIFKFKLECCSCMFWKSNHLIDVDLSNFNTEKVTNMVGMFGNCKNLTNINLSNLNTANVTNMMEMFGGCNKLTNIDLSNFNTKNVTNMKGMFIDCNNLTSINLSNFNTQNVTNMVGMFSGCKNLVNINLSNFDTKNVENMSVMFGKCKNLTSINLSNFNTQNVTKMKEMFMGCKSLASIDLSNFNTQNVTNMKGMFSGCKKLTNIIIKDKLSKERIIEEANDE